MASSHRTTGRWITRLACSGRLLLRIPRYLWKALRSLIKALLLLLPFLPALDDDCNDEDPPAPSVTPCFLRVLVVDSSGAPQNGISVKLGKETATQPTTISWSSTPLKTPNSGGLGCTSTCLSEVAYWHVYLEDYSANDFSSVDAWVFEPTSNTVTSTSTNGSWDDHQAPTDPYTYRFQSTNTCRTVLIKFTLA